MGKNATRGKAGKASSTGGKTASGGSGGKAPAAGSAHSLNLKNRGKDGKHSNQRSAATIKRLQMYRCSKAKRNRTGEIIQAAAFQSHVESGTRARVEPSRSWFANTKTISQGTLQKFQEDMKTVAANPFKVLLKKTALPVTLLSASQKTSRVHILETEKFGTTFGKKATRKRPKISAGSFQEFVNNVETAEQSYDSVNDKDIALTEAEAAEICKESPREYVFGAGASKRIWNELYKVIDSSDVVVQVLDARDPLGTRSRQIETYMKKEKSTKHLIFVLNKIDLVPTWATKKWISILSEEYPTVAFHASLMNPFGKGALINLLRQLGKLHKESKQISVGFIGYPNVGKSSVINALRSKKVCKVAPLAGETKVWQYITLMKKIYLIDCPGVVYSSEETDVEKVLKGVVRVENVEDPSVYIPAMLRKVKPEYISKTYKIEQWDSAKDFLEKVAQKSGKLLKGGEADIHNTSQMVLNDWQRGKLPYFTPPPGCQPPKRGMQVLPEEVSVGSLDDKKTAVPSPDLGEIDQDLPPAKKARLEVVDEDLPPAKKARPDMTDYEVLPTPAKKVRRSRLGLVSLW